MSYHVPMNTSKKYIDGLKHAREIAKNISKAMNLNEDDEQVFPYR